jgi:acyl-CoA hydrolase
MCDRSSELQDVDVMSIHLEGPAPHLDSPSFVAKPFFVGKNVRQAVQAGRAQYIPCFLSEIPLLFTRKIIPIDVALIQVSPPDAHGYCSLGTSVEVTITALECARTVIAQINPNMPRTHGDGMISVHCLDAMVHVDDPLPQCEPEKCSDVELAIGRNVADLVPDGACLQMGIGAIPNATLKSLTGHKRLGVHTEMFSDGLLELIDRGVVTGEEKCWGKNKVVASFVIGSKKLYDFLDDNPMVEFRRVSDVNNPSVISQNKNVIAINSCIEIDLTGQVCADSIGARIYSGVGGQLDFTRGATLSAGGKPIFAFSSTTSRGESKIVPMLKRGAGVTTTRAHVHYVVTEWGVSNLFGKSLHERAQSLIAVSHPGHREWLAKEFRDHYWASPEHG